MKNLTLSVFLFYFSNPAAGQDMDCYWLNNDLEKTGSINSKSLEKAINNDSMCAKNLLGKLFATGTVYPKDIERAYGIFYDLGSRGYSPAKYNMAKILADDTSSDIRNFSFFASGLYAELLASSKDADLASDILALAEKAFSLRGGDPTVPEARRIFYDSIKKVNEDFTFSTKAKEIRKKEVANSIVATIAIATLVYSAASALSAASAASSASYGGYSGYTYLPSATNLYYVQPLSSTTLYMLPLN
jgi:hypothetical protein